MERSLNDILRKCSLQTTEDRRQIKQRSILGCELTNITFKKLMLETIVPVNILRYYPDQSAEMRYKRKTKSGLKTFDCDVT